MTASRTPRAVAVALVATPVVIAAALVGLRLHYEPPTVPVYVADTGAAGERDLDPGGRFELTLRPSAEVTGAVGARAFLLRGDEVRPWDPPFAVARDGSVTIAGPVDALFAGVPAGSWQVAVAVGRPETLPTAPRDVLRARGRDARESAGWRLVTQDVRLSGAGRR
jgi:hypothetical protein